MEARLRVSGSHCGACPCSASASATRAGAGAGPPPHAVSGLPERFPPLQRTIRNRVLRHECRGAGPCALPQLRHSGGGGEPALRSWHPICFGGQYLSSRPLLCPQNRCFAEPASPHMSAQLSTGWEGRQACRQQLPLGMRLHRAHACKLKLPMWAAWIVLLQLRASALPLGQDGGPQTAPVLLVITFSRHPLFTS